MTQPIPAPPPGPLPPKPPPARIAAQPGTRLEQLLTQRDAALARRDEAAAQADAINEAIKNEVLASSLPVGTTVVHIAASRAWPALTLSWKRPWRLDSKRMKSEDPKTYVTYAVRSDGFWELRVADTRGKI